MDLQAIEKALSAATGSPASVKVEGDKLTFVIDGGDRVTAVGGFCGGETKGVITLYYPVIPFFVVARMVSGVNPLTNSQWRDLLALS